MRLLLLPLMLITACLQHVEQTSQEADTANTGKHLLNIAGRKVFISTGDKDKEHEANIETISGLNRQGNFGGRIKLEKSKPLHDAAPLMISKIVFDYTVEGKKYSCTLGGEEDSEIKLQRMIPFDIDSCQSSGEFIYGKYNLTHREHTIKVVAKIEMKNGMPTHLHLRRLAGKNAAESFEYSIPLGKVTPHPSNYLRIAYKGKSGDEEYKLAFNSDKIILDKMFLNYGEKTYRTTSHDVFKQADYDALAVAELESVDKSFVMTCIEGAGLNTKEASSMSIYERSHVGSDLLHFSNGECKHNIYGLSDPDVVSYLRECQATCGSLGNKSDGDPGKGKVFVLKFKKHEVAGYCKNEVIAFYRGKGHLSNRLYIMSRLATDGSTLAIWYDCKTGKHGPIE